MMVDASSGALPPLVDACRPRQWTKNLLVFAAPLFAFRFEADVWLPAGGALLAFCLISSATYLLNDCLDLPADRAHPSKLNRPIAEGLVSVPAALTTAAALAGEPELCCLGGAGPGRGGAALSQPPDQ